MVETAPPADVPPTQADEAGLSETVASSVTETISESVRVPSGKPKDVESSSSTTLELPTPSSVDTSVLIVLSILSMVLPQSAAEAIDADILRGLVTSPHAIMVEVLLKQFCAF